MAKVHLYAQLGQSNAQSAGTKGLDMTTAPGWLSAVNGDFTIMTENTGGVFVTYDAYVNSAVVLAGDIPIGQEARYCWHFLNDPARMNTFDNRPPRVVKHAVGGGGFQAWRGGPPKGANLAVAVPLIMAARAAIENEGFEVDLRCGVVCGETDASLLGEEYPDEPAECLQLSQDVVNNMTSLAGVLKNECGASRIVFTRVTNNPNYLATCLAQTRTNQKVVTDDLPYAFLVNSDDYTLVDTHHWDFAGVTLSGTKIFNTMWGYSTGI